jgi:hypothetical protein
MEHFFLMPDEPQPDRVRHLFHGPVKYTEQWGSPIMGDADRASTRASLDASAFQ